MTQALPGVWYANRHKLPCFIYVMDPWPEILSVVTGLKNEAAMGLISKMSSYIFKQSERVLIPSRAFRTVIENKDVPAGKIKYWPQYAESFYQQVQDADHPSIVKDEAFNIAFTGNIGYAQGLDMLVDAAEILRIRGLAVRFNMVGEGRFKAELMKSIDNKGLMPFFSFPGRFPADEIPNILASCHAALLTLSTDTTLAMYVPAKLQSYMACAVPVIAAANGESARIIAEAECGLCCSPNDPAGLADIIQRMMQMPVEHRRTLAENGLLYNAREFGKEALMDQLDSCITGLVGDTV